MKQKKEREIKKEEKKGNEEVMETKKEER